MKRIKETGYAKCKYMIGWLSKFNTRELHSAVFRKTLPPVSTEEGRAKWMILVDAAKPFAEISIDDIVNFISHEEAIMEIPWVDGNILIIDPESVDQWMKQYGANKTPSIKSQDMNHVLEEITQKGFFADCCHICQIKDQMEKPEDNFVLMDCGGKIIKRSPFKLLV